MASARAASTRASRSNGKSREQVEVKAEAREDVKPDVEQNGAEEDPVAKEVKQEDAPRRSGRSGRVAVKQEANGQLPAVDDAVAATAAKVEEAAEIAEEGAAAQATPKKKNTYNLTPGVTPFPDWASPTAEECQNVIDLLATVHERPERTMNPSTTMPGCGEVPAVLDALMRTMLSAATTSLNSSRAFQNIVSKYGLLTKGIGKGSVDWDKVRQGTQQELFQAIQCGGLAQNKSKNMKLILDMVYQENQERRRALLEAREAGDDSKAPDGAKNESREEQDAEIQLAEDQTLSLNHLHALSTPAAMEKLTSYPGIGVKTASCVLLFNFERGSFAVDTHVHRLCRWLGWVPNYATRDQTYAHCDVRIPDNLKYELHGYFWKHGKYCPKCQMISNKGRPELADKECVLEELIRSKGGRKAPSEKRGNGKSTPKKRKAPTPKGRQTKRSKRATSESEGEESELSDVGSD